MTSLFDKVALRETTFRNRIGVSPMCQYSAEDGFVGDWHLVHLGSRATGGAGLVMMEATAVMPEGRISYADTGLWSETHAEKLAPVTRFIRGQGAVPIVQLAHAGRKASRRKPWEGDADLPDTEGGWEVVAPSALAFAPGYRTPRELKPEGIAKIVSAFVRSSRWAVDAGFEGVEIHAAHGYLLHSFLSPVTNQRRDEYGGSFENRTRALLEVVAGVRKTVPERLPVFVRLSCSDWLTTGGWTIEESIALAVKLRSEGVDLVDCSSGGIAPGIRIPTEPGYQAPFAKAIRAGAGIATAAVGMITEAPQAEALVRDGTCDFVFLARALLRDPYWPLHAAKALGATAPVPPQYTRGF